MIQFKAVTFNGKKTATRVLDALEETSSSYIWMEEGDVAKISVNQKGHISVQSTWAQHSRRVAGDMSFGALVGGLLGLLLGPGGAIAGAAIGGSMGGLIGHHDNVKFDDPALDAFAASLVNDSSALVLLGPQTAIDEFSKEIIALKIYEFVEFKAELDNDDVEALKKAMKK